MVNTVTLVPVPIAWSGPPPPPGSVRLWLFSDHLGTPVVITAAASFARRRIFEPFGRLVAETELAGYAPPVFFTGKRWESAIAMYDFGARWYDPATAAFGAVDPVIGDLGNPLAINAYAYVLNRPMTMVDPDGRNGVVSGPSGFEGIGFGFAFTLNVSQPTIEPVAGADGGVGAGPAASRRVRNGHPSRLEADDWKQGAFTSAEHAAQRAGEEAAAQSAATTATQDRSGGRGSAGGGAPSGDTAAPSQFEPMTAFEAAAFLLQQIQSMDPIGFALQAYLAYEHAVVMPGLLLANSLYLFGGGAYAAVLATSSAGVKAGALYAAGIVFFAVGVVVVVGAFGLWGVGPFAPRGRD